MHDFTSVVYQTHCRVPAEAQGPFHGEDPRKAGIYETKQVSRPEVGYPQAWQFLSVYQDGIIETINSHDCDPQAFIE